MSQHTPGPRCSKCQWRHEVDSTLGTSFFGVALCPLHAQAPAMREALRWASNCLRDIAEQAGDIPYWNKGGDGYEALLQARAILQAIDGPGAAQRREP